MIPIKKFDRCPPEQRRREIKDAALGLFHEKGFAATTMENIVGRVSLSKGGVYRLYPSTAAILGDLMIDGMHQRNTFYRSRVEQAISEGHPPDLPFLIDMICDSLLLWPEISSVYVEFLWEKRRSPVLEALYQQIRTTTAQDTAALLVPYSSLLPGTENTMFLLEELMNTAILAVHVLGLGPEIQKHKALLTAAVSQLLTLPPEQSKEENEKENHHA